MIKPFGIQQGNCPLSTVNPHSFGYKSKVNFTTYLTLKERLYPLF